MMKRLGFLETKRKPRYSMRKLNVGMASVLLGVTIFGINFTNHSVKAATTESVEKSKQPSTGVLPTAEQTKGINAIGAVKVPSLTDSQNDANKAIDAALNKKKSEINGATTIDQTTKDKLNQAATDAADKAKEAINKATTNNDVATEQTNTQKATSATEKVQQNSASNNATANNSTEAATTSQSVPKTQGSADTDIKSSTAKSAAMNLVAIPSTDRNAAGTVAPFFYNLFSLGTGTQSAKENQDLANKTNLTSSDNYSSNIYKDKDGNYYKIVTINGHDYVYRTADIQANGTNILGTVKGTADDNKNNIHISKEDLGNGKTRWTVTFFPKMGLQNADSSTLHGLISAKFGIALTNDYQIVGNVDMKVKNKTDQTYIYYTFESGSSSAKRNTIQNPSPEVKFSFNPKTDVDKNTGLINSKTMPAYNNEYLQGPYYFTTATNAGKKNLWQTYFKYWGVESKANNNEYDRKPYVGTEHGLNFNNFKIVNENGVDGAKYGDPIIYDKLGDRLNSENGLANSESGVFSSDDFNQAMEFKSQGESTFNIFTDRSQHSSYVISFTTQHTDSDEVGLATGSKNQQFSGISANIYSDQNGYFNMYSRLYGEQRALNAKDDDHPLKAEDIIPNWNDAKAANKAIDDALVNKKGEINTATNIDQATKDNLIKEATDAADVAKNAIAEATTVDAIKKAQADGVGKINNINVPETSATKEAAKKAIDQAAQTKNEAIENSKLTDEEKAALKQTVSDDVQKAKAAIDDAKKADDVKKAQADGVGKINNINVPETSATKEAAKKAIDQAAQTKNEAIENSKLTDEEKAALKQTVSDDVQKAKAAIDDAKKADDVKKAQADGVGKINNINVPETSATKEAAKKAIDQAAQTKNEAIENSKLTDEEKAALKQTVSDDVQKAKAAIDDAKKADDVKKAQADGVGKINNINVPETSATKEAAKKAIDQAAQTKNEAIENSKLTDEEKAALKQTVSDDVQKAKAAIDDAKKADDVKKAQADGVGKINNINVPETSATKEAAKKAIDQAAQTKNEAIENSKLTDEEKAALKQTVSDDVQKAKAAIDDAKKADDVKKAQADGVGKINNINVPETSATKEAAKKAIDQAAQTKNEAIENSKLTDEEKAALKQTVSDDVQKAKAAIDDAKKADDVKKAQADGVGKINNINVPETSATKEAAKKAIDQAAQTKNEAIENSKLTDEEKAALKQTVSDDVQKAKAAIDDAKKADDVKKAQADGVGKINNINVPETSATKEAAKKAIDQAAQTKNEAIENSKLTDEEKAALKQTVSDDVQKAKAAIDDAKKADDVKKAQADGVGKINNINVPETSATKEAAKKAIDQAAQTKNEAIENSKLTDEEKAALKQTVSDDVQKAKAAIDDAKKADDVKKAQADGVGKINNINVPETSATKEAAKKAIDQAAQTKNEAIENSKLTDEEKAALKQTVSDDVQKAKAAIDDAKKADDVKKAQADGVGKINNINVPETSATKEAAKKAIDQAAQTKNEAIENSKLTDEEKAALKQTVSDDVQKAKAAIDDAKKADDVKKAQADGVGKINNINVPETSATKEAAKKAIDQAAQTKNEAIENSKLTDEEKAALKQTVSDDVQKAKAAIDDAKKADDVKKAQADGVGKINNINVPETSATKEAAKKAIDQAAQTKNEAIENSKLTDEEKAALKQTVSDDVQKAKAAIDDAKKADDVKKAQADGVGKINNINVPETSATKEAAKKAIDQAAQTKNEAIENSKLTDEEKAALKQTVSDDVQKAKAAIDDAKKADDVKKAQADGVGKINNINVPETSATKEAAKKAIDQAAQTKNEAIENSKLTDEEKAALKQTVSDDVQKAKAAIDDAKKADDVKKAQADGVGKINNINVPETSATKEAAKKAIDQAAQTKNEAIENSKLTDEEKAALKQTVSDDVQKAKAAIDDAKKADDVKKAQADGVGKINNINVPETSATKEAAKKAIDQAAQTKNEAIENSKLTDEEKAALKQTVSDDVQKAKAAIDDAKKADDVKKAQADGVGKINNINVPETSATKEAAKKAIDQAAQTKNEAIENSKLTDEEKAALKQTVSDDVQKAKAAIDDAKKADDVKKAQADGVGKINNINVPETSATKEAAKKAIDQAAQTKNEAIENSKLTDEEKAALKQTVSDDVQKAKAAIDDAKKADDVKKAQADGVGKINNINVPETSATKEAAKKAIDQAAQTKNEAIENSKLTDEEKAALKQTVSDDVQKAKAAIDDAKKADDVKKAQADGVGKINNINVPETSATKEAAKKAIDQAAQTKNEAIENSKLTDEEKAALKQTVSDDVQKAKAAIDDAKKADDVKKAQADGVGKINNINVPETSATKEAAKKAIDQAAQTKNEAIENSKLTDEEKAALKQTVSDDVQKAKAAIDDAKKADDVKKAQADGVGKINNINVPETSATKEAAKKAIDQAAQTKNEAIENSKLTDEEKAALKQTVSDDVQKAKAAIDDAKKADDVKKAQADGVGKINNINVPETSATKEAAKKAIDQAAQTKNEAIENSKLTDEEKAALKQTVSDDVQKAKAAIDDAKKADDVKKAQADGVGKINNINVPETSATKEAAKKAIDQAAQTKNEAIENSKLTDEEKAALKQTVSDDVQKAKAAIDDAKKADDVKKAQADGVGKINNINVPETSATKEAANKAIDDALAKKIDEINKSNLTDEEKAKLTTDANADANNAKANIQAAKTNDAVNTAKNNGISAINGITVKSNSVDDQDNSATNEGNGNQAGHIQSDNSSDVTKHSSTQQSGNVIDGSKNTIPGRDLIIGVKGEDISGNKHDSNSPSGSNTDDETNGNNVNNAEGMNGNTAKSGSKNNSLKTLPQKGTKDVTILEILGLFLSLFGLLGLKKKHREE